MNLLYRDSSLVIVDKPSGLSVHRGWDPGPDTALVRVRELIGQRVYPVHRLDRGASGALAFALDGDTAAALQQQLQDGAHRRYLALVRGTPPDEGIIDHPIPRREGGPRVPAVTAFRRLAVVDADGPGGRPCRYALVEAAPKTGRLHQVRRHLKHLGHPVIGDANYGRGEHNRHLAATVGLTRLALHAAALSLVHPVTGATIVVEAAVPEDLAGPLARLGIQAALDPE